MSKIWASTIRGEYRLRHKYTPDGYKYIVDLQVFTIVRARGGWAFSAGFPWAQWLVATYWNSLDQSKYPTLLYDGEYLYGFRIREDALRFIEQVLMSWNDNSS